MVKQLPRHSQGTAVVFLCSPICPDTHDPLLSLEYGEVLCLESELITCCYETRTLVTVTKKAHYFTLYYLFL